MRGVLIVSSIVLFVATAGCSRPLIYGREHDGQTVEVSEGTLFRIRLEKPDRNGPPERWQERTPPQIEGQAVRFVAKREEAGAQGGPPFEVFEMQAAMPGESAVAFQRVPFGSDNPVVGSEATFDDDYHLRIRVLTR